MIFTDGVHMISDTSVEELHEFAKVMELNRCWFHNPREGRPRPHYDLIRKGALGAAIEKGAAGVSPLDLVRILRGIEVN